MKIVKIIWPNISKPRTYTVRDVRTAITMFCQEQHMTYASVEYKEPKGKFSFKTIEGAGFEGFGISEEDLAKMLAEGRTIEDKLKKVFMDNVKE